MGGELAASPRDAARPEATATSCDVECQSAGWRDKKTCPRRRLTTACGRAGPPDADSRRAGGARDTLARVPRDFPAVCRSRRSGPTSRRSPRGTPFRGYARRGISRRVSRAQPRTSQSIVERPLPASSTRVSHGRQRRDRQARSRSTYARNAPRHSRRAPTIRPGSRRAGVPCTRCTRESRTRWGDNGDIIPLLCSFRNCRTIANPRIAV